MAKLFVKRGNQVEHDGVLYSNESTAGPELPAMSDLQAKALLEAGVVQTTDPQNGASELDTHTPTEEEIAAAAASQDQKKGLLNFGK